jgi:hypothetical protein
MMTIFLILWNGKSGGKCMYGHNTEHGKRDDESQFRDFLLLVFGPLEESRL